MTFSRPPWTFTSLISMVWFVIASVIAIWAIAEFTSDLGELAKVIVFVAAAAWSSVAGHFFGRGSALLDDR